MRQQKIVQDSAIVIFQFSGLLLRKPVGLYIQLLYLHL